MKYTVWSKSKSGNWVIERSYGAKIYAQQHANAINKGTNRIAKIIKRK